MNMSTLANAKGFAASLLLLAAVLCSSVASAQRVLTTPDFSAFSERRGTGQPAFYGTTPTPDGGLLVTGRFEVWYEGQAYRDILLLRPDGLPDTTFRPQRGYVDPWVGGSLAVLLATPHGVFIGGGGQAGPAYGAFMCSASLTSVNGAATSGAFYIRWGQGGTADVLIPPQWSRVMAYEAATDMVYTFDHSTCTGSAGSNYARYGRFAARTLVRDGSWSANIYEPGGPDNVVTMLADSSNRLWLSGPGVQRCDVGTTGLGSCTPLNVSSANLEQPLLFAREGGYVYVWNRRYRVQDGAEDATWRPAFIPSGLDSGYVYGLAYISVRGPFGVRRSSTASLGEADPTWGFDYQSSTAASVAGSIWTQFTPLPTTSGERDVAALLFARQGSADPIVRQLALVVPGSAAVPSPALEVVEYYAPALKRYFITGRAGEQTALDGLPQSFQRTGMKFTAKSSKYRDIAEQPVCRMYASPEKGMSNSHFYGIGSDCATLNKLSGLKYEGYDFSILKPTAEQACPAEASKPVTRLFNNKVASNESNHRYVVSAATKAKMLSQGWVDEGVVFCASAVTDAGS